MVDHEILLLTGEGVLRLAHSPAGMTSEDHTYESERPGIVPGRAKVMGFDNKPRVVNVLFWKPPLPFPQELVPYIRVDDLGKLRG